MDNQSFEHFVRVLRCVYLGRSTFALSLLYDIPQEEREDWHRLATTFRDLIGDTLCSEYIREHTSFGSKDRSNRHAPIGD